MELNLTTGIIYAATFVTAYILIKLLGKKQDLLKRPPCLPKFPVVGSLPWLPKLPKFHTFFFEKSKDLGGIVAFYIRNRYVIVLNGRDTIQEALVKQSLIFADRPTFYLSAIFPNQHLGLIEHPYNEHFKKFHRLSLNILRNFGFGQGIMESRIRVEVEILLKGFELKGGQAFDPNHEIKSSVSNVICSIMYGKRWEIDDPEFQEGINIIESQFIDLEKLSMINFFPLTRFLPGFRRAMDFYKYLEVRFQNHLTKVVDNHVNKGVESFYHNLKDEIEKDMETEEYSHSGRTPEKDNVRLAMTIRDLFLAGTETTATTLLWFIVLMANHQDVQKRVRDEMDRVIGRHRYPALEDKPKLPHLEATLLELLRYKTLVPLAVPHSTLKDTVINDVFIPSNTLVFVNLYSCHMDPNVWKEPEKFNIDRFLDETKQIVIKRDQVVSFSLGKRACLGEILARQELFLFASALIHEFEILPPLGETKIDVTEVITVTIAPSAFKARLIKRQS